MTATSHPTGPMRTHRNDIPFPALLTNGGGAVGELRAVSAATAIALALATTLVLAILRSHPRVSLVTADGSRLPPTALARGALRFGNSDATLDSALAAGRSLALARFAYSPSGLNDSLHRVSAAATPEGRAALDASIPRAMLSWLVLADSGWVSIREFGAGAYSYGERPGVIQVVVPLTGRFWSRHVPYLGPTSGIPLGATVVLRLRRIASTWQLDTISGELLAPALFALWDQYDVARRPRPSYAPSAVDDQDGLHNAEPRSLRPRSGAGS